jgi:hypothetical protein
MADETKQKTMKTGADLLRHAEALLAFEARAKTPAAPAVSSLSALAPAGTAAPKTAEAKAPDDGGNVIRAFPVRKKDTKT